MYNLKFKYFLELSHSKINFETITELGDQIMKMENLLHKKFEEMMNISMNNSKLIYLFIQFRRSICFDSQQELIDYYGRLDYLKNKEANLTTLPDRIKNNKKIDLYGKNNMLLFVHVYKSKFNICKFSSNVPQFFGYSSSELKGMNIE